MTPSTDSVTARPDDRSPNPVAGEGRRQPPAIWESFTPREGGILDLVDDMLARCVNDQVRIVWCPGVVTEYPLSGTSPTSFEVTLRNSAFRAVMARMAVLCERPDSEPVSPYGGRGEFTDRRWPRVRFSLQFTNTADDQRLELTPIIESDRSHVR